MDVISNFPIVEVPDLGVQRFPTWLREGETRASALRVVGGLVSDIVASPLEVDPMLDSLEQRVNSMELSGSASVPNYGWQEWSRKGSVGPEPAKENRLSFHEIAKKGKGWKLHLNFDPDDPKSVEAVDAQLKALHAKQLITQYKLDNGGGRAAGAPGKEATVYVGHRDKAALVAEFLDKKLTNILTAPEGDTLTDDMVIAGKVMGRFQINGLDMQFEQYGGKGFPYLSKEAGEYIFQKNPSRKQILKKAAEDRSIAILEQRYGAFYTGSPKKWYPASARS
jgi:hypothetical protein